MSAPVPLWLAFGFMAVGAFYGTWMQAMGFADHLGTALSWQQHVVFASPVALTLGWLWVGTSFHKPLPCKHCGRTRRDPVEGG